MADTSDAGPARVGFAQACAFASIAGRCAFSATPVFSDDGQSVEGVRLFLITGDGKGSHQIRFIAGPFFSQALAADDVISADEVPDRVRELHYLTSDSYDPGWPEEQIQILLARLMAAAGVAPGGMPDYLNAPAPAAASEVSFPVRWLGSGGPND